MNLVTSPFNKHRAVTMTFKFIATRESRFSEFAHCSVDMAVEKIILGVFNVHKYAYCLEIYD